MLQLSRSCLTRIFAVFVERRVVSEMTISANHQHCDGRYSLPLPGPPAMLLGKLLYVLLLPPTALFIFGFIVQQEISKSSCDMTWSAPTYTPISVQSNSTYTLYRYSDRRKITPQCSSPPVIFVPGHWGSHEQGRSFGGHSVNMGYVRSSTNTPNPAKFSYSPPSLDPSIDPTLTTNFYDLYTISFNSESSALHANYIDRQSLFLIQSIAAIKSTCPAFDTVTLIGHSIGGIVALNMFNHKSYKTYFEANPVSTIVTLATPHKHSPITLDRSVRDLWMGLGSVPSDTLLVPVTGGWRDELIPPQLAHDESYTTSQLARAVPGECGLDHKAIVWCRNVLYPLREVVVSVNRAVGVSDPPQTVVEKLVGNPISLEEGLGEERARLVAEFGELKFFAYTLRGNDMLEYVLLCWLVLTVMGVDGVGLEYSLVVV